MKFVHQVYFGIIFCAISLNKANYHAKKLINHFSINLTHPYFKHRYLVSRHLHQLEDLNANNTVGLTDRGVGFLSGQRPSASDHPKKKGRMAEFQSSSSSSSSSLGCPRLLRLSLAGCREVTDAAVWAMVNRMPKLAVSSRIFF